MKSIIVTLLLAVLLVSCKQNNTPTQSKKTPVPAVSTKKYPAAIAETFKAHGSIDKWNTLNNLCFTIEKEDGNETHTIDLKSRKVRIETDKFALGFDGEKVWLDQDSTYFAPQKARFYHNLMFYFYAMPFVLGDEGISYADEKPLEFEGVSYPGTRISFGANVGDAPDDEYIIYSDPKTNEMAWLAYTVTYGKDGKSDRFSYIKYNQWKDVNGVKLPSKMDWYKVENGVPTEMLSGRSFIKPTATATVLDAAIFDKPESGKFAE